jgi:hypothetical protein
LELPSIQLPCLVRYRRNPEMRLDEAVAPYTTEEPVLYGQLLTRREEVTEIPVIRRTEVEPPARTTVRSADTEVCPPPQADNRAQVEMLQQLLRQTQTPCAETTRSEAQVPLNQSLESINQEYRARIQQMIQERERQVEEAKRELEMLRLQQSFLPSDYYNSQNKLPQAPPSAPSPDK